MSSLARRLQDWAFWHCSFLQFKFKAVWVNPSHLQTVSPNFFHLMFVCFPEHNALCTFIFCFFLSLCCQFSILLFTTVDNRFLNLESWWHVHSCRAHMNQHILSSQRLNQLKVMSVWQMCPWTHVPHRLWRAAPRPMRACDHNLSQLI